MSAELTSFIHLLSVPLPKYTPFRLWKCYFVVYFFLIDIHIQITYETLENLNPKHTWKFISTVHVEFHMFLLKLSPQQHQVKAQFSFHMTYMVNHCLRLWLEEMAIPDYTMETKNQHIVNQYHWTVSDSQQKDGGQSYLMRVGLFEWGNLIVFLSTTFTLWFSLTICEQTQTK